MLVVQARVMLHEPRHRKHRDPASTELKLRAYLPLKKQINPSPSTDSRALQFHDSREVAKVTRGPNTTGDVPCYPEVAPQG
jgi:hypothetical protein